MENRLESGVGYVMHVTTQCDEPHKGGSAMVDEGVAQSTDQLVKNPHYGAPG
jgi:hypothetical protein